MLGFLSRQERAVRANVQPRPRVEVTVNEALLMRLLYRLADLAKETEPLAEGELVPVTILSDLQAAPPRRQCLLA